jgi:hypothetical protein
VSGQPAVIDHRDLAGRRFHVGDDMSGQDDDALARQLREQVAETHPLLGVEAHRGLVDDQQPRIVEQRLGDADTLAHAAREAAERPAAGASQVDQLQQLVDAGAHPPRLDPLDRRQVLQELAGAEIGIDAEILRQIAEHPAQRARVADHVLALPQHAAGGGPGDRGQDAHQRRLAGAVGPQQTEHSRRQRQAEAAERFDAASINLVNRLDGEHADPSAARCPARNRHPAAGRATPASYLRPRRAEVTATTPCRGRAPPVCCGRAPDRRGG